MTTVSYTEARVRLAALLDEVISSREEVITKRRGHPDVALIAADELSSLQETVHLSTTSDHDKETFLIFSQEAQRPQSLDCRAYGVFKPGMGENLENCCERVGGNSKGRDQICGHSDSHLRFG